ncbi:Dcp1p-Dcp2p decapping enzyme complex alpha subunit [Podila epicladia]|nr:Dcp1p-Dcp2p decapping enzyme complex alpha subunit [Podila epicladia]
MPFEFGVPIDPGFRKVLQSRIRTLLQAKMEGFPGSFPVFFEQSHLQNLTSEEYFVMEKVAGVRYMLLSTITPKGPACFLIDRHFEISFVPQLLLPLRDNPAKYQNDTLLDGEMVIESDSTKKTLRFLVFDLMVLNGTVVTQRSYSTRLGMMDQDILAVQSNKSHDIKSKEPFTLKWKSHVTAQFQVKVTQSKERKPLYCIQTRQGTGNKFYDYVTPDPGLAVEWHNNSPDGKTFEFWWDAQWPTQMFEKGYGLETRTGGWRFYRVREDKKEADEEATLQTIMKSQDSSVTKEQLESQIETIRTQWKAREHSGGSSNGGVSQPGLSSQRPSMRPLTITNNSHSENQPLPTPAISSHYLQSPSVTSHSGTLSYFSKKDRERKSSIDDHHHHSNSHATSAQGTFSHPLPPKPPPQLRQPSVDHSSMTLSTSCDSPGNRTPPSTSLVPSNTKLSEPKLPSPVATISSTSLETPSTSPPTPTSTSPVALTAAPAATTKNPLKLSQIPEHLQPIKSWMTVSPVSRASPGERPYKTTKLDRGDKTDTGSPKGASPRTGGNQNVSRKSSLVAIDTPQQVNVGAGSFGLLQPDQLSSISATSNAAVVMVTPATTALTPLPFMPLLPPTLQLLAEHDTQPQPQTPTPASTPTVRSASTLILPATSLSSFSPASVPKDIDSGKSTDQSNMESEMSNDSPNRMMPPGPPQLLSTSGATSQAPSPVLGKRGVETSSAGEHIEDSLSQKRKLSDVMQPSPRTESVVSGFGTLNLVSSLSPRVMSRQLQISPLNDEANQISFYDSQAGIPRDIPIDQSHPLQSHRTIKASMLSHEVSASSTDDRDMTRKTEDTVDDEKGSMDMELDDIKSEPSIQDVSLKAKAELNNEEQKKEASSKDHAMNDAPKMDGDHLQHVATSTLFKSETLLSASTKEEYGSLPHDKSAHAPHVTLTAAEKLAYSMPSDQQKRITIAKATAEALVKLESQREKQLIKEKRRQQDLEKFKVNSKVHKEKVQRIQEVVQLQASQRESQVQDRRAQPVRQTQQQARQSQLADIAGTRGPVQTNQRASPQETQRLVYQTRNSKSTTKIEPQEAPYSSDSGREQPNSTQLRQAKQSALQPPTQVPVQQSPMEIPTVSTKEPSIGPAQRSSGASTPETKGHVPRESTRGNHRRINSMDYNSHISQSMGSLNVPEQYNQGHQEASERAFGLPFSKRLDIGQHEPNHRRSHSDAGIYKPVVTTIVPPQQVVRPPTMSVQETELHANNPAHQPDQHLHHAGAQHRTIPSDERAQRYAVATAPPVRTEQLSVKRESKATLQFILNDNPSPEAYPPMEPVEASEGAPWSDPGQTYGMRSHTQPRISTANTHAGFQQTFSEERLPYGILDSEMQHRGMPPASVANRRQTTKKQKMAQDIVVDVPHVGKGEPFDQPSRHSPAHHGQPLPNPGAQTSQRAPQDRWNPPTQAQQQQQQSQPSQQNIHVQHAHQSQHGIQHPVHPSPQSSQLPARRPVNEVQEPIYPPNMQPVSRHFPGDPSQMATQSLRGSHPELPEDLHVLPHTDSARQHLERPTHSRHSSLTNPMPAPESHTQGHPQSHPQSHTQGHPQSHPQSHTQGHPQGPGYQQRGTHVSQGQHHTDPYLRSAAQGQGQGPPPSNAQHHPLPVEMLQQQQQQQQQQLSIRASSRKKEVMEQHAGPYGQTFGPQGGAEQNHRQAHPQHIQQQQPQLHQSFRQHSQQHPMHAQVRPAEQDPHGHGRGHSHSLSHGHSHKSSQSQVQQQQQQQGQSNPQQYRGHHEAVSHSPSQQFYDHEGLPAGYTSGRSSAYGSQNLHPSSAHERTSSFQAYQSAPSASEQPYRSYPAGMRPPPSDSTPISKEDQLRGPGGRGSAGHLPGEHGLQAHPHPHAHLSSSTAPSHRQYAQHAAQAHPQQQHQDYRQSGAPYHPQHSSQPKMIPMPDHGQPYSPHHAPPKAPSPRGPPVYASDQSGDHEPVYRPPIPHGHGGQRW